MFSALVVLFRLVAGLVILAGTWFVLDTIHDRNTEIIVATIGLLYSFIFIVSGRLQYFGLTVFSFFGRTSSYVQKIPYDDMLRNSHPFIRLSMEAYECHLRLRRNPLCVHLKVADRQDPARGRLEAAPCRPQLSL